jgi:hypothetical protein
VNAGYLPVLGAALRHDPWIAAACAFALTPGSFALIAWLLERRWLVPGEQFTAITWGDPALAVAVGMGTWLSGPRLPRGPTGPVAGTMVLVGCLVFGLAQWRSEVQRGYFTRAQAVAPTKIWHQLVIYPVLGYWTWTSGVDGLLRAAGIAGWAMRVLFLALVGTWAAANIYDRRHPKLGHPPFDWRRRRPYPQPWPAESPTLQAGSRERP